MIVWETKRLGDEDRRDGLELYDDDDDGIINKNYLLQTLG